MDHQEKSSFGDHKFVLPKRRFPRVRWDPWEMGTSRSLHDSYNEHTMAVWHRAHWDPNFTSKNLRLGSINLIGPLRSKAPWLRGSSAAQIRCPRGSAVPGPVDPMPRGFKQDWEPPKQKPILAPVSWIPRGREAERPSSLAMCIAGGLAALAALAALASVGPPPPKQGRVCASYLYSGPRDPCGYGSCGAVC